MLVWQSILFRSIPFRSHIPIKSVKIVLYKFCVYSCVHVVRNVPRSASLQANNLKVVYAVVLLLRLESFVAAMQGSARTFPEGEIASKGDENDSLSSSDGGASFCVVKMMSTSFVVK